MVQSYLSASNKLNIMLQKYLLDPFNLPIYGKKFIQAPAGTGKTYILSILYVRLLLGLTNSTEVYQGYFTVKDIILITFNDELSKKLKFKIKTIITKLKLACLSNKSNNKIINEFLIRINDRFKAFIILDSAVKEFNEAYIFNSMTFCIRILGSYVYKSYSICEYKLLTEEQKFYKKFIQTFWKEHIGGIKDFALYKLVVSYWPTVQSFIKVIEPFLKNKIIKLHKKFNSTALIEEVYKNNIKNICQLKSILNLLTLDKLINAIKPLKLNKKIYSLEKITKYFNKIQIWSKKEKLYYPIPREIRYFYLPYLRKYSTTVLNKNTYIYILCARIGRCLNKIVDIKTFIIQKTILVLNNQISLEKENNLLLTYDDLFRLTEDILLNNKSSRYTNKICSKSSIVLIDELQDLNVHILKMFYNLLPNITNIILLGDPKQSIYNFMGSDLNWYFKIKKSIYDVYKMKINWRSSAKLITTFNWLFKNIKNAFLLSNIRFEKIYPAKVNKTLSFQINGVEQKSLILWYYSNNDDGIKPNVYKHIMAKQCAYQIKEWLLLISQNKAKLIYNNKIRNLTRRDIVILVRNQLEAYIVKKELYNLHIDSVYSFPGNIYNTVEAYELLNLLHFIYFFKQTNIYTNIASNNILSISSIPKTHTQNKESLLELTFYYKNLWLKYGVLSMLKTFCKEEKIWINLLDNPDKENILCNIFHLGEIIQTKSCNHTEPTYILRWLENRLNNKNYSEENIRLIQNNVITILSIHKSKGLEFPIVCLPFISDFTNRINNLNDFNKQTKIRLYLENTKRNLYALKNRLSEDLRLLYVALNRAIFQCCIGISPITKYVKKNKTTDLHKNSLGYLLQKNKLFTVQETNLLIENITKEQKKNITVVWLINNLLSYRDSYINQVMPTIDHQDDVYDKSLVGHKTNITSFSSLMKIYKNKQPNLLMNNYPIDKSNKQILPTGLSSGKLLHDLLENIDFVVPLQKIWLKEKLIMNGYSDNRLLIYLYKWLTKIIIYPFNSNGFSLANITRQQQIRELKFVMSIKHQVKIEDLNSLFTKYLNRSLSFVEDIVIKDLFKGMIDLVFLWEGKYYILDFKSNFLGDTKYNYKMALLKNIIYKNYYWFQYHIYTLAMHRYLILRNNTYDYKIDFGGVIYFFIRAVNYIHKYTFDQKDLINKFGLFYVLPDYKLINELNDLFTQT